MKRNTHTIMILITAFFLSSGYAKEPSDPRYSAVNVENGARIFGIVTFDGAIPELKDLQVNKDKKVCGHATSNESIVVDPTTRGVKNAVLLLREITAGKEWSIAEDDLAIDQKGCMFLPHVLVVPTGQPFNMLNSDGILHNVHTRSEKNEPVNKAQPKYLKKIQLSFAKPEFVKVSCDVHSWMGAWVVVADHPYYAVTDENGNFELADVPAGSYVLELWHETLGKQTREIKITPSEELEANFDLMMAK